jgi:tetratricopeptide (TPR) repeat protein
MYVFSGQLQEAQTAYQELISNFGGYAGIAKTVCEVADIYLYLNRQPQRALELYQYVFNTWPNSKDAMWAQAGIVKVYAQSGDESSAQAAYATLLANYSTHLNISEAVYEIGDSYQQLNPRKALELYEYAMSTWPNYSKWVDENDALLRRKNLVLLKLGLGDEAGARAAYDSMIGFSTDDIATAEAVTELANAYLDSGKHERARQLFEYAKARWSSAGISEIWAQVGLAKTDIALGKDPNLQSPTGFLNRFSQDPDLTNAVFAIVERYYVEAAGKENKGDSTGATKYLQEAIRRWKKIADGSYGPATPSLTAETRYLIAESYYRLGEYQEAIRHYKEVTANWPNFERAQHVHLMIGDSYERLKKAKVLSQSVTDSEIINSYQKVVESNPDSPVAKIAARRLSSYQAQ